MVLKIMRLIYDQVLVVPLPDNAGVTPDKVISRDQDIEALLLHFLQRLVPYFLAITVLHDTEPRRPITEVLCPGLDC